MKTTIKIFRPDGTVEERDVSDTMTAEPGYSALRDLITPLLDGRNMEHVSVLHDGQRADMFVDEEGHLLGLPRNEAATTIYRNNWLTQHPDVDPETIPFIVGPAVLFSRRVWF
jgi:hypothetical protein